MVGRISSINKIEAWCKGEWSKAKPPVEEGEGDPRATMALHLHSQLHRQLHSQLQNQLREKVPTRRNDENNTYLCRSHASPDWSPDDLSDEN
jgi:hypothetical protein